MSPYYAIVERSMTRNCLADFTAVTRHVDNVLANGTTKEITVLKRELLSAVKASPADLNPDISNEDANELDNPTVGFLLLMPLSFFQYYGFQRSVLPFCDILETQNRTHLPMTDNGGIPKAIAPASGLALEFNISTAWNAFLVALVETNYDEIVSPTPPDPSAGYGWMYQLCSEYGFYQRGNPDNLHTIESQFISLGYFQAQCDETYPGVLPPSQMSRSRTNTEDG